VRRTDSEVATEVSCTLDKRSKAVVPMRDVAPAVADELLRASTTDIKDTTTNDSEAIFSQVMTDIYYIQIIPLVLSTSILS